MEGPAPSLHCFEVVNEYIMGVPVPAINAPKIQAETIILVTIF